MDTMDEKEGCGTLILSGIILLVIILLACIQPYQEMVRFNKFTDGPKATFWDAVWCKLCIVTEHKAEAVEVETVETSTE